MTIDAPGGTNAESLLGHLASDKKYGGEDDFADMSSLEDASDHDRSSPKQSLFTPTLDISEPGMVRNSPAFMQAKGSESQLVVHLTMTLIDDHHVEVSTPVVVRFPPRSTSPQRAKSPGNAKAPIKTLIDGHHVEVSAIVIVPSPSRHTSPRKTKSLRDVKALLPDNDTLVLQNHFSFFDGLETTIVGGDPHIGASIIPTSIVEFKYDHITVENWVVSKFGLILMGWRSMPVIPGRK